MGTRTGVFVQPLWLYVMVAYLHPVPGVGSHPMRPSRHTQSLIVTLEGIACIMIPAIVVTRRRSQVKVATYYLFNRYNGMA